MKSDAGLGWTQNEVQNVALRAPALFGKRVSPMQELLDWMRSDACTIVKTDDEIKASFWSNPLRLGSSLHGRVRPRHDLAAQLGKKVTLFNICSDPDPTFAERLEIGVGESPPITVQRPASSVDLCTIIYVHVNWWRYTRGRCPSRV